MSTKTKRQSSVNSTERTSHDLVKKYTDQPHRFAYYEQLVATPPMRQNRRASTIVNRILIILIVLASLSFLFLRAGPKFSEADRACIQDEWQENKSLNVSSEINNDTYRIVFSDVQKEFKWIVLPEEIPGNPEILMIVSSNPDNFARRNVIRKSWMNSEKNKIVAEKRMKILFLVGIDSKNEKENTVVLKEAEVFGDMIVVDLEDNYQNLPYKSLTIMLYGQSKAPESVKLIGKIDEDVIFYPDQLTPLINDGTINMSISAIYGEKWNAGVEVSNKDETSKWFIPKSSFKCQLLPSYLSGPFYLTTRKAAERIVKSTKHRKFISVEDVFITGLLAGDVGVEKNELPFLYMYDELMPGSGFLDPESWIRIPGSGFLDPESWIQIPRSGILDPDSWIRIPGSGFLDPDSWIRIPGSSILDPDSWIRIPGSGFLNPDSWIRIPGSGFLDPDSWIRNPGSGFLDPESWIQIPRSGILDPDSWIRIPGSGILDPDSWIRILGSGFLDPESWIRIPGSGFLDPDSWIRIPGSRFLDPESGFRNPGSGFLDPDSWIRNPGSGILDPDSFTTDTAKAEILAWHNFKNNVEFLESWENLRLSRCKACRKSRNFRGSRSQLDEERNQ
ncbi:unnamed protein product [Caenorhabditis nigoni]